MASANVRNCTEGLSSIRYAVLYTVFISSLCMQKNTYIINIYIYSDIDMKAHAEYNNYPAEHYIDYPKYIIYASMHQLAQTLAFYCDHLLKLALVYIRPTQSETPSLCNIARNT